jgi:diguanylate cyclase (GGDEF)-like protein
MKQEELPDMSDFDSNIIGIMNHMYKNNIMNDEMLGLLKDMMIDRQLVMLKNVVLKEKLNYDIKTNLLKYSKDYLSIILKAASRMSDLFPGDHYSVTFIRYDIDDFSAINNRYGHDFGDRVLFDFSELLRGNSRPTDYLIRFGGEEFDVILPATDREGGIRFMTKINSQVKKLKFKYEDISVGFSVSAGMSTKRFDIEEVKRIDEDKITGLYESIQSATDDALYDAKISGKSCFRIHDISKDYSVLRDKYVKLKFVQVS